MSDVVLYREDKDGIYFIESVISVGPMDGFEAYDRDFSNDQNVTAGKMFLTAVTFLWCSKSFQIVWHGKQRCGSRRCLTT